MTYQQTKGKHTSTQTKIKENSRKTKSRFPSHQATTRKQFDPTNTFVYRSKTMVLLTNIKENNIQTRCKKNQTNIYYRTPVIPKTKLIRK